ncbi:MAG: SLC13 family permease, partial [Anaerolineales bacterium]
MTLDMWVAIFILFAAILLFITEWVRVDVVALGVIIALILTNLLSPQEALSGFSNPAVLTIAALFMVGGAVMQTGLADAIGRRILVIAGSSAVRLTAVLMTTVALLSAVMSDTGTVAVLLPAIISLAVGAKISSSKLLIPLAYGALLGGATTLIGTPPNIIVSDLLREQGLTPFGFFDYTPIGFVLFLAGIGFMLLVGRRILPDYKPKTEVQRVETPEELVDLYRLPDNLYRLRVRRGSYLIGLSLAEANLRQDFGLNILDILRADQNKSAPLSEEAGSALGLQETGSTRLTADTFFQLNDTLIAQGDVTDITQAAATWNLGVQPAKADDEAALISNEVGIAEIILPPRSSLLGKNLVETRFGSIYHLTVLDIHRPGSESELSLKDTSLRFGDTLLVQGPWKNILDLRKKRRDFIVMGQPETMVGAPARAKAPLALLILLGMLLLMITNLVPIVAASLLAALAMILTGCLSIDEAYDVVDWKS